MNIEDFNDDNTVFRVASEDDDIAEARSQAIDDWFKRLESAMPTDGNLTDEVVRVAGKLPAVLDPYGLEEDRESAFFEAQVYAQAGATARVETVVALAYSERARARGSNSMSHLPVIEFDAKVRYWEAVSRWIASMERDA